MDATATISALTALLVSKLPYAWVKSFSNNAVTFLICAREFLMSFCSFVVAAAGYDLSSKRLLSRLIRTSASEAVLIFDLMDVAAADRSVGCPLAPRPMAIAPGVHYPARPEISLERSCANFESILKKFAPS